MFELKKIIYFLLFWTFIITLSLPYFGFFTKKGIAYKILGALSSFYIVNIYFTQVFLSAISQLKAGKFLLLNSAILLITILAIFIKMKKEKYKDLSSPVIRFIEKEKKYTEEKPYAIEKFIMILGFGGAIFSTLSVVIASFIFPPRGIDDISYHIPKIVENVLGKRFVSLDVDLDPRFAFPISGQMLSQAYVLLFKNLVFIDSTNIFFAVLSALSIYVISEKLFRERISSIISSLFVFSTPIVIGQMASNYVDLAFAAFFVSSWAFSVSKNFFLSGAMAGLLISTKYIGFLLLPFIAFIAKKESSEYKEKSKIAITKFLLGLLLTGSFFYIMNIKEFETPFYPPPWTKEGELIYPQPHPLKSPKDLLNIIHILGAFFKYDNLELSFHKGFSLIFWFITLPSFLYFTFRERFWRKTEFWLLIIPLAYLLWRSIPSIHVNARFLIWFVFTTFLFFSYVGRKKFFMLWTSAVFTINLALIPFKMVKTEWPIFVNKKKNSCPNTISNLLDSGKPLWYENFEEPASFLEFLGEIMKKEKKKNLSIGICNALFYGDKLQNKINCSSKNEQIDIKLSFLKILKGKVVQKLEEKITGYEKIFYGNDFEIFIRKDIFEKEKELISRVKENYLKCRAQK